MGGVQIQLGQNGSCVSVSCQGRVLHVSHIHRQYLGEATPTLSFHEFRRTVSETCATVLIQSAEAL